MSTQRCPTCDRAECPCLSAFAMDHVEGHRNDCPPCAASDDCRAHAVDWRARALAAESRLASAPPEVEPTPGERILSADALVMVPPRAGALCRAAIKWREWARKLEKTAPEDADEELIAAVDEFLGARTRRTP